MGEPGQCVFPICYYNKSVCNAQSYWYETNLHLDVVWMIDLHLDGVLEFYQTILFFEFEACFELVSCPIQIGDL